MSCEMNNTLIHTLVILRRSIIIFRKLNEMTLPSIMHSVCAMMKHTQVRVRDLNYISSVAIETML